jgi:hypothetical protein
MGLRNLVIRGAIDALCSRLCLPGYRPARFFESQKIRNES